MKSKEYYISQIMAHAEEIRKKIGVKSLRLFGSVSRNEQKEGSDVDVCVDMEQVLSVDDYYNSPEEYHGKMLLAFAIISPMVILTLMVTLSLT